MILKNRSELKISDMSTKNTLRDAFVVAPYEVDQDSCAVEVLGTLALTSPASAADTRSVGLPGDSFIPVRHDGSALSPAESFGLPFYEISLNDNQLQRKFFGDIAMGSYRLFDANAGDSALGQIAYALIDSGVQQPSLFFDEASEQFPRPEVRNVIKKLVGGDNFSVPLHAFGNGVQIDASRATFIFAGNARLPEDALNSRMPTLTFGALSPSVRKGVSRTHAQSLLRDEINLPKSVRNLVWLRIEACLSYLFASESRCGSPGVRILKDVTAALVDHLLSDIEEGGKFDLEYSKQIIDEGFARFSCRGDASLGQKEVTGR